LLISVANSYFLFFLRLAPWVALNRYVVALPDGECTVMAGYYWPPAAPSADTMDGWLKIVSDHGYRETDDARLEPEFEKVAIYGTFDTPEHVARQKASGVWVSKMGIGKDIEHTTLAALEGALYGTVVKIMKRKCKDGQRVLE
jgi:hypothetical protein